MQTYEFPHAKEIDVFSEKWLKDFSMQNKIYAYSRLVSTFSRITVGFSDVLHKIGSRTVMNFIFKNLKFIKSNWKKRIVTGNVLRRKILSPNVLEKYYPYSSEMIYKREKGQSSITIREHLMRKLTKNGRHAKLKDLPINKMIKSRDATKLTLDVLELPDEKLFAIIASDNKSGEVKKRVIEKLLEFDGKKKKTKTWIATIVSLMAFNWTYPERMLGLLDLEGRESLKYLNDYFVKAISKKYKKKKKYTKRTLKNIEKLILPIVNHQKEKVRVSFLKRLKINEEMDYWTDLQGLKKENKRMYCEFYRIIEKSTDQSISSYAKEKILQECAQ